GGLHGLGAGEVCLELLGDPEGRGEAQEEIAGRAGDLMKAGLAVEDRGEGDEEPAAAAAGDRRGRALGVAADELPVVLDPAAEPRGVRAPVAQRLGEAGV